MNAAKIIDILVQSIEGRPITIVEIRNWHHLPTDIVMDLLTQLKQDAALFNTPVPYLLVISKEKGYLWKYPEYEQLNALPVLEFSLKNILENYLGASNSNRFTEAELQLVILSWLTNLAWLTEEPVEEPEKSLVQVGFIEAIRGATVLIEASLYDRVR